MYVKFPRLISTPGDEYVSLIQFLLDQGADPNIISSSAAVQDHDRWYGVDGTTFDQFALELLALWVKPFEKPRNLTIFKRLTAAGSEFSKPFNPLSRIVSESCCLFFEMEVERFSVFEDQIDR